MSSPRFVTAVLPTGSAEGARRPVDAARVELTDGFWAAGLERNRTRTLPHGAAHLHRANNLANFAALIDGGRYRAGRDDSGAAFPFLDSDVYKWLEAAGWELGRQPDRRLAAEADEMIDLITRAQRSDGYLNTYVQLTTPGHEFEDLRWAHELYSAGHLIQAAVAWSRALGDDRLLNVARRYADRIDAEFRPGRNEGTDGHPEIEMALVELYRLTGEDRYLALAGRLVAARGHGRLGADRFGPQYWQDHAPVRTADRPVGHAVRQLYLDCGAVDLAMETGDRELLDAVIRRWEDMVGNRTYVNGAIGSHHRDESFGDPYELPSDRAYAETCAAIASVMLSWRLLLATGQARFADLAERTLYNAVLPAIGLDGTHFFYVNPLQRRSDHTADGPGANSAARAEWFACACCPPNIMRLLASWPQQLFTVDDTRTGGISVQQYATARAAVELAGGRVGLDVTTDYPWDATVTVRITETPASAWALNLRVPGWTTQPSARLNGAALDVAPVDGYLRLDREWRTGDVVTVSFALPVRRIVADRRIDAVRGCVAVQRGPILYCLEQVDLPDGVAVDDVALVDVHDEPVASPIPGIPLGLRAVFVHLDPARPAWPYQAVAASNGTGPSGLEADVGEDAERLTAILVPYLAWANRAVGPMRVWIPTY